MLIERVDEFVTAAHQCGAESTIVCVATTAVGEKIILRTLIRHAIERLGADETKRVIDRAFAGHDEIEDFTGRVRR